MDKKTLKTTVLIFVLACSIAVLAFHTRGYGGLHGLFGMGNAIHSRPVYSRPSVGERDKSSFVGIVLWPPNPRKKTDITPPRRTNTTDVSTRSVPTVIPFDGAYWYFKAPANKPGPKAHVVRGEPTFVNIHSTDWKPLLMEAHQSLGSSINLDCCTEIDVTITNADNRPGRISIGMILTNSTSPDKPSQYLGERSIVSSEVPHFSMNRPPSEEKLRFQIVKGKLQAFDEITLVFLPAKERSLGGAKVAIRQFTLIPR